MTPTRISRLFDCCRKEQRGALIAYLTAGDPTPAETPSLVAAMVRGGADLIELGVPFSDPVADGPVIQRASDRALAAGTSLHTVLAIAREVRKTSEVPIVLFTYLNPVVRYGLEALARDAHESGIDGCLLTDLSVEEADPYVEAMHRNGLDTIFLAAPTSSQRRRELVSKYSTGFVYLVSRTGVTGEQASLSQAAGPLVTSMRGITDLPLAVGFGISRREHVAALRGTCDGVVVGSAFMRLIEQNAGDEQLPAKLEALTRELKSGLEAARA
ncbi:MAG: tryptophan synthase subunit alpha [Acidobacteria bacterium]|nr:tryptophan synthase subunit alpha [Acidobacteriota bacterium]